MIYTSYFQNPILKKEPISRQVAISVGLPRWGFKGRRIKELAPTWAMVKLAEKEYRPEYQKILDKLNPHDLDLREGDILLCWEKPPEFCHRYMVSDWLNAAGIECEELINVPIGTMKA
jgi:uncharacterized protein (DUF488 family)